MALLAAGEAYATGAILSGKADHAGMVGGAIAAVAVSAVLGPARRAAKSEELEERPSILTPVPVHAAANRR